MINPTPQEASFQSMRARIAELSEALAAAQKERDAARERIEDLGEMAGVCVGRYLGRRCSYCQCDGKNLSDHQTEPSDLGDGTGLTPDEIRGARKAAAISDHQTGNGGSPK